MSHYDCSNCGVYGGIGWGICRDCTPKEYLDLSQDIKSLYGECDKAWEDHIAKEKERWKTQWLKENGLNEKRERLAEIQKEYEEQIGRKVR